MAYQLSIGETRYNEIVIDFIGQTMWCYTASMYFITDDWLILWLDVHGHGVNNKKLETRVRMLKHQAISSHSVD